MPVTHGELVAETINSDPEFRREWERLALARKLAVDLIRYRSNTGLSQRALAERLGTKQPQVARLESGEHNPRFETVANVVKVTGIEICIDFVPEGRESKLTNKRAQQQAGSRSLQDGVSVIAASA